ncbi:hypothetical protein BKA57DRAFT_501389 [Linnemannia elongata]|nr:hypothetical protein BKA57DRAFT_501389 [Linnemannia elongata]
MKPKTLIPICPRGQGHKLIPVEVWEHILRYLYPSQLSRFSMVNKNFCVIVSSLDVWSRMFVIAYGPKAHLRTLVGVPRSKSYMMFMCSSSVHVCERCFGRTGYNAGSKFKLPLPIPVLLPKRSTDTVKYLGERVTSLPTKNRSHDTLKNSKLDEYQLHQQYPCAQDVSGFRFHVRRTASIDETMVIQTMRQHFGGDVGITAFKESTEAYDEKTEVRIRWYQLQE